MSISVGPSSKKMSIIRSMVNIYSNTYTRRIEILMIILGVKVHLQLQMNLKLLLLPEMEAMMEGAEYKHQMAIKKL